MGTATTKQDRIGARVPREVYQTLCRAAQLSGATVNQFLVQSALKEAQAVIEREEMIRISPRDWSWLLDLMENPPKPNARLKAAMKRYQKVTFPLYLVLQPNGIMPPILAYADR